MPGAFFCGLYGFFREKQVQPVFMVKSRNRTVMVCHIPSNPRKPSEQAGEISCALYAAFLLFVTCLLLPCRQTFPRRQQPMPSA